MKDIGKKIAETVCEVWNTLGGSLFESILSNDFEYISVWVLETMKRISILNTSMVSLNLLGGETFLFQQRFCIRKLSANMW